MTKAITAVLLTVLAVTPALAFDANQTFSKGSTVLSVEAGGGHQGNLEGHRVQSGLDLLYFGARYALLPFAPAGPGILRGAFEAGLGPMLQTYEGAAAKHAQWAGVGVQARWHFLSLGRLVPYLEGGVAAGGTNLRVREIDSEFAFLLHFGAGVSVFLTDRAALYGGYRMVHVSNGNIDTPTRGFEAHTGLLSVSYFFK
jgi:opacity protein-like surface antigen